ncbi:hypothetical protein [Crocosphaera sp.]|uniref:hypothetical protein n=1 Tax=Crocosphaera sp. TaxID=2729996 RepID=UPI003F27860A
MKADEIYFVHKTRFVDSHSKIWSGSLVTIDENTGILTFEYLLNDDKNFTVKMHISRIRSIKFTSDQSVPFQLDANLDLTTALVSDWKNPFDREIYIDKSFYDDLHKNEKDKFLKLKKLGEDDKNIRIAGTIIGYSNRRFILNCETKDGKTIRLDNIDPRLIDLWVRGI